MTSRDAFDEELKAREIGKLLQRAATDTAPLNWGDFGANRLVRSVHALRPRWPRVIRWPSFAWAAAATALVAGGLWLAVERPTTRTVSFNVLGADLSNSTYVVAPADAPASMNFSQSV